MGEVITAWDKMQIVHDPKRPTIKDYIPLIFNEFYEMHGDRLYGEDPALLGGIAYFQKLPVTILATLKGKDIKSNQQCNFAMAHPEGYRKALRLAKQAEKFKRPIICFIDTPGAYCGIAAEEHGQGNAIATNLMEFMRLKTPIISIVTGEGGSGGALALGVCDDLAMFEHAIYSVISPRGCANILWRDSRREKEAANIIRMTAADLLEFKIADSIIKEPIGGAQADLPSMAQSVIEYLFIKLRKNLQKDIAKLLTDRYNKFRQIGKYQEF